MKAHFIGYMDGFEEIPPQPLFNVYREWPRRDYPHGSTVGIQTLLEFGVAPPVIPEYCFWKEEIEAKRRCINCWAVTRTQADRENHQRTVHKVKAETESAPF